MPMGADIFLEGRRERRLLLDALLLLTCGDCVMSRAVSSESYSRSSSEIAPEEIVSVRLSRGPGLPYSASCSSSSIMLSSSSSTLSASPPKPSPSTTQNDGMAAIVAMKDKTHHGRITYPILTPYVNVEPPIAGPSARPTAPTLVAIPFRVPRIRRLLAELVRRMVEHGNAKVETSKVSGLLRWSEDEETYRSL